MMRGIATPFEKHHKVQILDEALEARCACRIGISGGQLPDKAIKLIDTASARVAISQHAVPAEVDDSRGGFRRWRRKLKSSGANRTWYRP